MTKVKLVNGTVINASDVILNNGSLNITTADHTVEELAKIAEAYKMKLEQVKSFIPAVEIRKDLVINKAIDFVKENAEITAE